MLLTREIRLSLFSAPEWASAPINNSWAGWPTASIIAPYLIVRSTVSGEIDPTRGYFCNVKELDKLLRSYAIRGLQQALVDSNGRLTGDRAAQLIWSEIAPRIPPGATLERMELKTTPFLRYERRRTDSMIRITQQFEFSASHRLHCASLSDEENRHLFGKCNNPNGHGHNYRVDITIAAPADPQTGLVVGLPEFERIVRSQVIDRFDHRNLNLDLSEFESLNPTVENIAVVIWGLLVGRFDGADLECVRVFETPKTWAEYFGGQSDDPVNLASPARTE